MEEALYAVTIRRGHAAFQRIPISRSNERFFILSEPYPLPNGYAKRIFNREEEIIPTSEELAVQYYLLNLAKHRIECEKTIKDIDLRAAAVKKLLNQDDTSDNT